MAQDCSRLAQAKVAEKRKKPALEFRAGPGWRASPSIEGIGGNPKLKLSLGFCRFHDQRLTATRIDHPGASIIPVLTSLSWYPNSKERQPAETNRGDG